MIDEKKVTDADFEETPEPKNEALATVNNQSITAEVKVTGLAAMGEISAMREQLELSNARIELVHSFIADNFNPGVDFGESYKGGSNTLLKPGAEKVCKLINTSFRFVKDSETYEMLGDPKGIVCYRCEIIDNNTGVVIGEGRGAATLGDKKRDANKTIKNAEKCALVDAALYTFSLSSMFTQDLPTKQNIFQIEQDALWNDICDMRLGVDSSMNNTQFWKAVATNFCHGVPKTTGAIRALRKAVLDDGLYDPGTGERIPE